MGKGTRSYPVWVCSLLVVLSMAWALAGGPAQVAGAQGDTTPPRTPADTPTPVVSENLNEWTLSDGLLYWARRCYGGELRGDGYLRRRPVHGGTTRTLSTVNRNNCLTFVGMAADASGLYYYSVDGNGIYHRPVSAPGDPATLVLSTGQAPVTDSHLVLDGDYVYWVADSRQVLRVNKNGSSFQTVAFTGTNPNDVAVVNGAVYWLDDDGLWATNVACGALPCPKSELVDSKGDHLYYHVPASTFLWLFQLYWVQDAKPIEQKPQQIRRYSCWWVIQPYPNPPKVVCDTDTLYTAPETDWDLGELGTNGSHLFWTEHNTWLSEGRLRRMPIDGGTAVDIVVNRPEIDASLYTDNLYVYFADLSTAHQGIHRLPFNASAIVRDLAADALEVTQGIQNLANGVPLVAEKTTYVRGYGRVHSGPAASNVEAWLYGTRGGSPMPGSPLQPVNGTLALAPGAGYDRAELDDGWLFPLPTSWTEAGVVDLKLVVDPRHNYDDPNRNNNEHSKGLSFAKKAPVCIVFLPVRTHSIARASHEIPNFGAMLDRAKRLWPAYDIWTYYLTEDIAELQGCWWGPFPYPCYGPYELPSDTWKVMTSLWLRDAGSDDPDKCDDVNAETHYVGMVHSSTDTGTTNGSGSLVTAHAWVKLPRSYPSPGPDPYWPDKGTTLAHELAHNLGREHVPCGVAEDVDNGYPYPVDQLDNVGQANHYGFDVKTRTPIPPDGARDLMGYCTPKWTSDYTWKALFNGIDSRKPAVAPGQPDLAAAADAVLARGGVTPSTSTGELSYAWVYPTNALSPGILQKWQALASGTEGRAAAGYHLRLLDSGNNVLADVPVSPARLVDVPSTDGVQVFATTFPRPAGAVSRLELLQNGTLLDSLAPGGSVPTVTITKPAGGETIGDDMQLVWQATDADDGDALLFNVQYSPDNGQTWLALLSDYPGPPDSDTVTVNLTGLGIPGSNQGEARIRVAASDGYNTGLATSAPFTVLNRGPEPHIVSPAAGETTPAGKPALLSGYATDAEDGSLDGDLLSWAVGGQDVGSGQELLLYGLAPGEYPVELTAFDGDDRQESAQATLKISPLGIPLGAAPLLDGFCDDGAYAAGVQVQLAPYSDGAQATVHLLRSSDHLWACFSGLATGSGGPGAFAGVEVDANYSRDGFKQPSDPGFYVREDGGYTVYTGDGAGGVVDAGASGFQGQVSASGDTWSAELRIEADKVGGWNSTVGMSLAHYWARYQGDENEWPYQTVWTKPNTWATAVLGALPEIAGLDPASATAGNPGLTLAVEGQGFVDGAKMRWDGAALATTFVDSGRLSAAVDAARLAAAGTFAITVQNPGDGSLVSNALPFVVSDRVPQISSLSPSWVDAGGAAFTLTVNGSNFVNGASVLWDGEACPTTYASTSKLTAQIDASRIAQGRTVGVTVRNPGPDGQVSNPGTFIVRGQGGAEVEVFLPLVLR